MQLEVEWNGAEGLIKAFVLLSPETPAEHEHCKQWCGAHRPTRLAVHENEFEDWERAHARGDAQRVSWMMRPIVLLWDRPFVFRATPNGRLAWQEEIPDTAIARQLLARLAAALTLDEVAVTIEQLMLEQQLPTPADCASAPTASRSA